MPGCGPALNILEYFPTEEVKKMSCLLTKESVPQASDKYCC